MFNHLDIISQTLVCSILNKLLINLLRLARHNCSYELLIRTRKNFIVPNLLSLASFGNAKHPKNERIL